MFPDPLGPFVPAPAVAVVDEADEVRRADHVEVQVQHQVLQLGVRQRRQ